jgi:hypothetical protein
VDDTVEGLWVSSKGQWQALPVPSTFMGKPFAYEGPNPMTLFAKGEDPQGKPMFQALATVQLNPASPEQVLLVREDPPVDGLRQVKGLAIDAAPDRFPPGAYLLMNYTGQPVAFLFDGESVPLATGEWKIFRPQGSGQRPIQVQFAHPGAAAERSFISTTWFHNERHRDLVFLFAEGEGIRVKSVRHFAAKE